MPSSKKDKKHAKESGGISAAVTKQAAGKFSNNQGGSNASNKSHTASSDASSPPANTPEIKPTHPDHGNQVAASPLLDALSTTSASPNTAPSMTNEWAKTVMAGSPGNLINLTSESPPTQPSSYEDSARLHNGWAAHRPFMSPSPASLSPPNASHRRPLSFQSDAQYHIAGTPPRATSAAYRRSSLYSQYNPSASPLQPPLPHQPQPHFYGAQDLDLTITPRSGMKAGDHGLYVGFDRLPKGPGASPKADRVIVAGYEGGLQVYAVNRRGVELISSLKGLRGGVHQAKILPWTMASDQSSNFPLVAVVVHGPVLPPRPADTENHQHGTSRATPDSSASPRPAYAQPDGLPPRSAPPIQFYQTTVEIYSLKTNKLVDVLLEAPRVPINMEISLSSPLFQPPSPSGAFNIKTNAGTVAVCSGITGECWIYRQLLESQNGHMFACSGKIWTTLQQSYRAEVAEETDKTGSASSASHRPSPQTPIFALNGHWIAYCPSNPSSQAALRAHLPVPTLGRAPGVSSMAPPHLPTVSSAVDLSVSDSMMNKFMRETTQEVIQGMKWVGQQGLQAWNSYWNQPSNTQTPQQQARSPPQQWAGSRSPQMEQTQFPPTHGTSAPATAKDPGLVCILDVETLPGSAAVHPHTTFATPLGCSFVSFSPSSLSLFTASTKGDVQTVWDLLRLQHTHSSPLQSTLAQNESTGPQVRQIAQFSRMTVARIVEVAWTEPHGDRLAMVTERGTVHLLDMPFSAFMWPPPRRRKIAAKGGAAEQSEASSSAVSIASGALGAAYQAAKPFVSRSRHGSSNTTSPSTGNTLRDSAAQGGRVIAASITHSIGKTGTAINQLRHTGENRVSLPPSVVLPSNACVTWLAGRRRSQMLFSVGDGLVRLFPCKSRPSASVPVKRVSRANKYQDIKVPLLPDDVVAPIIRQIVELGAADEVLELSEAEMEAGNTLTLKPPKSTLPRHGLEATIPQAEIESSAPYQPFHTDRRVVLCEYSRGTSGVTVEAAADAPGNTNLDEQPTSSKKKKNRQSGEASNTTSAWAFGQDIPSIQRDLGLPDTPDDDIVGPEDHMALPQSAMERVMQYGDAEQIVVTTRRRRGVRQGEGDEDGFFEDDCEVLDFADQRV